MIGVSSEVPTPWIDFDALVSPLVSESNDQPLTNSEKLHPADPAESMKFNIAPSTEATSKALRLASTVLWRKKELGKENLPTLFLHCI